MTRATYLETFIFDLDGTLIELNLDFERIRHALGIKERFILEAISKLNDERLKREKLEILKRFEIESALRSNLMPYAREIIEKLDELGLKKGIVTRNCRESVNIILKRFDLKFDFVITREDAEPKPSPKPIQLALKLTKSEPSKSITVGDFKFDLIAGKKAGTKTALVLTERNRCMIHEFIHLADYVLHSLKDIEKLLR
jgi:HAD superfamily hydrolase (TIGR01509 family)